MSLTKVGQKVTLYPGPQKLCRAIYKVMILVVGHVYIIILGRAWLQNKARKELPW